MERNTNLKNFENEQETLSTSLQALTSHFAQVQFRLRQIISAPDEQKFNLIENLDEFASRGIPELNSYDDNDENMLSAINQQRVDQFELIKKLQTELSAVSNFANKNQIDLDIKNTEIKVNEEAFVDSTDNDLRHLKSQLLNLDTVVTDLRYESVNLMQMTQSMDGYRNCEKIYRVHSNVDGITLSLDEDDCIFAEDDDDFSVRKKPSTLQGCGKLLQTRQGSFIESKIDGTNPIKCSSTKVCHWGNIRAKLEIDVQNIISVVSIEPLETYQVEQSKGIHFVLQKEITKIVRKELCGTLREVIEHGLLPFQYEINFLSCCIGRGNKRKKLPNKGESKSRHAWDIIMEFYNLNNGNRRYRKPCNTLRNSFQLEHVPSNKDQLLQTIGDIINIHVRSNTSQNSYFKAFVLAGLNLRKLPQFLSMIFKCSELIEANYSDESLVCQPEFVDLLICLDLLSKYEFNLPINTFRDNDKNNFY